jgi:hypothetical protein
MKTTWHFDSKNSEVTRRMNSVKIVFFGGLFLIFMACQNTQYWRNRHFTFPHEPAGEEIHISKRSFAHYQSEDYKCMPSNSGSVQLREAELRGDTVLVYHHRIYRDSLNQINFNKYVEYAFICKGRKMFQIWSFIPFSVWRNDYSMNWEKDSSYIDTSKLVSFSPTWPGWSGKSAYIDYGDPSYYKKGQNRRLRKHLNKKMKDGDAAIWYYEGGYILTEDTLTHYQFKDTLGPLRFNAYHPNQWLKEHE